jgi:hypothetical protein
MDCKKDVGIIAMEIYFPSTFIAQELLGWSPNYEEIGGDSLLYIQDFKKFSD